MLLEHACSPFSHFPLTLGALSLWPYPLPTNPCHLQAQTLKFSLQPGQDEPVSLETIAEPPKVLAAVWARADLIKLVVSAMHTGSRVLVHVEGLHRAIPCRVEVSSATSLAANPTKGLARAVFMGGLTSQYLASCWSSIHHPPAAESPWRCAGTAPQTLHCIPQERGQLQQHAMG